MRTTWSGRRLRAVAEITPAGTPIRMERTNAVSDSSNVAGKKSRRSAATGRRVRRLIPRSPLQQAGDVDPILLGHGLVQPIFLAEGIDLRFGGVITQRHDGRVGRDEV